MDSKFRELGSEFWLDYLQEEDDCIFVLSGRTAIDLILQDICVMDRDARRVYMPAWCCDSMLQPFVDRGVDIRLYNIRYENGHLLYDIEETNDIDIFYVTNYFGYDNTLSVDAVLHFKQSGAIIVYDRTHSLLRDNDVLDGIADYTFCSIRKWMGVICGAYLKKNSGVLHKPVLQECPFLADRINAMEMKAAYISEDNNINKQDFLAKYALFGYLLERDYRNYRMDKLSVLIWQYADKFTMKKVRTANAEMLQYHLKEISQVKPMFIIEDGDCPLFVPVLLGSKEERNALRRHLTANNIYCPVHWPKPALLEGSLQAITIYDRELSLLCDQRYGFADMQRIIDAIKEFYQ